MNQIVVVALLAWPVVSLALCAALGAWRGVIASYLAAYVLLPSGVGVPMAGLPDYTKFTAAHVGALVGVLVFDAGRLAAFRPRWYDAIGLAVFFSPAASTLANGMPPWDAISGCSTATLLWVAAFFVGRLYSDRPGAARDLALGMAICGGLTAPLILFEVAAQRSLSGLIYGLPRSTGYKYGLYNPIVMAHHALEMGLWTTLTALSAFALWCGRAVRSVLGIPFGLLAAINVLSAVACHQATAVSLLIVGSLILSMTIGQRRFGKTPESAVLAGIILLAPRLGGRFTLTGLIGFGALRRLRDRDPGRLLVTLSLFTPVYLLARLTGLVPTRIIAMLAFVLLGGNRGHSMSFRLDAEDRLKVPIFAMKPFFSWGTFEGGHFNAFSVHGKALLDSNWILQFGMYGLVGLTAVYAMLCMPVYLTARRSPGSAWVNPANAAVGALLACLLVYTLDSLINAHTMPAVSLTAGLLMGMPGVAASAGRSWARSEASADRELERVDRLATTGRLAEAEAACRRLIAARAEVAGGHGPLADACDRLADLLEATRRDDEAEPARRHAFELRAAVAAADPADPAAREALAGCGERLARNLGRRGRFAAAADLRGLALEQRAALAAVDPDDAEALALYADGLNDLAWLLAVAAGPAARDPARAVALAERAAQLGPGRKTYWNTLGAAYRAAGEPRAAVAALRRSLQLGPDESGFDDALLAASLADMGDADGASSALARLDARLSRLGTSAPPALLRLRAEAADALRSIAPAVAT